LELECCETDGAPVMETKGIFFPASSYKGCDLIEPRNRSIYLSASLISDVFHCVNVFHVCLVLITNLANQVLEVFTVLWS
jgi:hypothetical protein